MSDWSIMGREKLQIFKRVLTTYRGSKLIIVQKCDQNWKKKKMLVGLLYSTPTQHYWGHRMHNWKATSTRGLSYYKTALLGILKSTCFMEAAVAKRLPPTVSPVYINHTHIFQVLQYPKISSLKQVSSYKKTVSFSFKLLWPVFLFF